jgi:hypothetical protein
MRFVARGAICGGLALALAFGGLNSVSAQTKQQTRSSASREVRRLSTVIGGAVQIANSVSVGKIEDLVLNDSGCIEYVVVASRDQYVAIPWSVVTVDFGQRIATVDITEERFATVPRFGRDEFSSLTKTEFTQNVHSVFDEKGAPQPKPSAVPSKAVPKATTNATRPEPAKPAAQENPKVQSTEKPQGQPLEKAKGEPKEKPAR